MEKIARDTIINGFEVRYIGLEKDYVEYSLKTNRKLSYQIIKDLLALKKIEETQYYTYCKMIDIINAKIEVYNKIYK